MPQTIDEKKRLLLDNNIAVWDVIHSCEIIGSSDSSIKNVVPNDIVFILENSNVCKIFTNGKKAEALYRECIKNKVGIEAVCLLSTSPANAAWSVERLTAEWKNSIIQYII